MNGRQPTRVRWGAAVAAVLAAAVLTSCSGGSNAVDQGTGSYRFVSGTGLGKVIPAASRKPVGNVTGSLLDGGSYALTSDAGKVVVMNFWATWCGPCTTETPQFDSIYRQYKSKGVEFVGIDTKETNRDAPRAFVKDNDISYPIVFDEQGEAAIELGKIPSQSLPFTVLIDRHDRVAAVYLRVLSPADLTPVLNQLVAEP